MASTFTTEGDITIEVVPACSLHLDDIVVDNRGDTLKLISEPRPFMGYVRALYQNLSNDRAWGFREWQPLCRVTRIRGLIDTV